MSDLEQALADIQAASGGAVENAAEEVVEEAKEVEIEEGAAEEAAKETEGASPSDHPAYKKGWRPKEEWHGDPEDWVDADEFIRREPFFKEIKTLKKALNDRDQKIDSVTKYVQNLEETTRKRVVAELEAQRKKAVEEGDVEAFESLDKQIQETNKPIEPPKAEEKPNEIPPYVQEFVGRNTWFEKDEDMTDFMVATNTKLINQGISPDRAIKMAEERVKAAFAHKFANPNKTKGSPVAGNNPESRPAKITHAQLTEEQRGVWSVLKKTMTFDDFVKGLRDQGEFK